jgi:hypothetical protein
MKVIFHIGMGKTGTSSIQNSLNESSAELKIQKARYLGLWFDVVDPSFAQFKGQQIFFAQSDHEMMKSASAFASSLGEISKSESIETFIISNESMFAQVDALLPFFSSLKRQCHLKILAYIRSPSDWLSSAYVQWGVVHKENKGPIQSFEQRARTLIGQYEAFRIWQSNFPDIFEVRQFSKGLDIVSDFSQTTSLRIRNNGKRVLERFEQAEVLIRAVYNNRFQQSVLPDQFEKSVFRPRYDQQLSLRQAMDLCFAGQRVSEIISERHDLFQYIKSELGFDYIDDVKDESFVEIDGPSIRSDIVDHLVEIVCQQGDRITSLEKQIRDLNNRSPIK